MDGQGCQSAATIHSTDQQALQAEARKLRGDNSVGVGSSTGCFFWTGPVLIIAKSLTKKGKRGQLSLFVRDFAIINTLNFLGGTSQKHHPVLFSFALREDLKRAALYLRA